MSGSVLFCVNYVWKSYFLTCDRDWGRGGVASCQAATLCGGWVCLERVRGHHDIPKQPNGQLDGNQLTSCYEKVLLCFYPPQTIDGGQPGGPLIHFVPRTAELKSSRAAQPKLVSHQSSIWCQSIHWSSNFFFFNPFYILHAKPIDKENGAIEQHKGLVLAVNRLSLQVAYDKGF